MPRAPKKTTRRRRRKLVRKAPIGKSLGFPKTNRVQLRYCQHIELSDAVGGLMKTAAFRANSIYAPAQTGGHQPLGHDQWNNYYNHYRVVESKIRVAYHSYYQVAQQVPVVSGMYLSDDLVFPSEWTTLAESGRGTYQLEGNLNTETRHLNCTYNQTSFFKGQGKNQSQLGASMGANPSELAFFVIWMQAADESSLAAARSFLVTIDYLVEFSEPKDLAQS